MKKHYSMGLYPLTSPCYRITYWKSWVHYINPMTYWETLKYFCQRGYRGYADCDHWDAHSYVECVLHGVLKELQEHKHGFPAHFSDIPEEDYGKEGTDYSKDKGSEKWAACLQEMIDGLEAAHELRVEDTVPDEVYPHMGDPWEWEECFPEEGEKPYTNPMTGKVEKLYTMKEPADGIPRFNREAHDKWSAPLKAKRKRGMFLIVKHWECLWD